MSHFTVLACISLPADVSSAMQAIPEQALALSPVEQTLLETVPESPENPMLIRVSNRRYLETVVEQLADERLEPYCECPDKEEYLEFYDMTQEGRTQYETGGVDCIRMPDGKVVPFYDSRFTRLYELYEGRIYKRCYGPLHHRKRTRKAKQLLVLPDYPYKKLYPSFDSFMKEYHGYSFVEQENAYGYYSNPNAKWDWYQIGGRWPFRFLVKDECALAVSGEFSHMFDKTPEDKGPDGYRWVAGARKCDIAWEVMKEFYRTSAVKHFHQYKEWIDTGVIPRENWDYGITEEGIVCWGDLVYRRGETLDEYLHRCGLSEKIKYPLSTFAYVSEAGWEGSGDMGWFGMSSNNKDELEWNRMVENLIAALPDDAFLVSVDCHI